MVPDDDYRQRLAEIIEADQAHRARRQLWLSHHWPDQYHPRCVRIGNQWVCRRCLALYPLALVVAGLTALIEPLGPAWFDWWLVLALPIPSTLAYCGEALGWFDYDQRVQGPTMVLGAVGLGRGLGYELVERWSPQFWVPLVLFGSLWLAATVHNWITAQRAATARSSSSSVL